MADPPFKEGIGHARVTKLSPAVLARVRGEEGAPAKVVKVLSVEMARFPETSLLFNL